VDELDGKAVVEAQRTQQLETQTLQLQKDVKSTSEGMDELRTSFKASICLGRLRLDHANSIDLWNFRKQ
jgi:hypothetical protein